MSRSTRITLYGILSFMCLWQRIDAVFIKDLLITDLVIEEQYKPNLCTSVACLNLSSKNIHTLKGIDTTCVYYNEILYDIAEIPNLYINLNHNTLGSFEGIEQLENLVGLSLVNVHIAKLPEVIGQIKNLKILDISRNFLTQLPANFKNFTQLEELDISTNLFTNLPAIIGECPALLALRARQNKIITLPHTVSKLKRLAYLDLSDNELEDEALSSLAPMILLKDLNVSENKLVLIPEAITKLPELRVLNVSSNRIEVIPDTIGLMENLEVLDLQFCALEYIPEEIGFLPNLRGLYLFNIKSLAILKQLLALFGTFPSLIKGSIFTDNREIQKAFHDRITANISLNKHISVWPANRLRIYPGKYNELDIALCNIQNLNDIDSIYVSHKGETKLITEIENLALNLSGNEIEEFSSLCKLDNLISLRIDQNPLGCLEGKKSPCSFENILNAENLDQLSSLEYLKLPYHFVSQAQKQKINFIELIARLPRLKFLEAGDALNEKTFHNMGKMLKKNVTLIELSEKGNI